MGAYSWRLVESRPELRAAFDRAAARARERGLDPSDADYLGEVYAEAGMTPAEQQVARLQHNGVSRSQIAVITDRADGTVNPLLARAHRKLRALAQRLEEEAA